jgi:hypothetical protein
MRPKEWLLGCSPGASSRKGLLPVPGTPCLDVRCFARLLAVITFPHSGHGLGARAYAIFWWAAVVPFFAAFFATRFAAGRFTARFATFLAGLFADFLATFFAGRFAGLAAT